MGNALQVTQSDTQPRKRKPGQRGKDISGHEVADILRWHGQGLTQEQIAAKFDPPRAQSAICEILQRFGPDRTVAAKAILRGGAADMAMNIVRRGQPKDQVQALKGLGVLEENQAQGVTVIVGGGGEVKIGIMVQQPEPTFAIETSAVSLCKTEPSVDIGSDKA
jgi:hypothetical protein